MNMKQDKTAGKLNIRETHCVLVGTAVPFGVPNSFRGVPYINSIPTAKAAIKEYGY